MKCWFGLRIIWYVQFLSCIGVHILQHKKKRLFHHVTGYRKELQNRSFNLMKQKKKMRDLLNKDNSNENWCIPWRIETERIFEIFRYKLIRSVPIVWTAPALCIIAMYQNLHINVVRKFRINKKYCF